MCGITGFYGGFDEPLLRAMTDILAHRGPDDAGIVRIPEHSVGLGHRRLSIIDLSRNGQQPMWDATGTILITYNGEIYNYRELRGQLESRGYRFRSTSDTEVLLNLYLDVGLKMFSRLNGIFAFAIWDTRSSDLILARDGVGVKPLYFSQTQRGFLFASELKALLLSPEVDRSIDKEAVYHYLTYLYCPSPRTILSHVKKLQPGHAMIVRDGAIHKQFQFYELPYNQDIDQLDEDEAASQLKERLRDAVRRQLVADVEVGAFLSGGLDSSSVVALAQEAMPERRMSCFTIRFRGEDPELLREMGTDLPYAERVAQHLGVNLHHIDVGPDLIDHLETMIYHLDEPQGDVAPLNVYLISQLAREHGIKVLLSGAGGDDILGGYRRHYALSLEKYWAWLPRPIRRGMRALAERTSVSSNAGRRFTRAFLHADSNPDNRLSAYFRWARHEVVESLFDRDVRDELGHLRSCTLVDEALLSLDGNVAPLNKMLYLDGKFFLTDHNLNYTDKMSMSVGVETRVPLLDPDLYAFAARLPPHMKQRGSVGKWLFKKTMEEYLPREVIYRPKVGFGAPLIYWLQHQLRSVADEVLSHDTLTKRGLFDPEGVRRLLELNRARRVEASYTIFTLMCIEIWCRLFIDSQDVYRPNG